MIDTEEEDFYGKVGLPRHPWGTRKMTHGISPIFQKYSTEHPLKWREFSGEFFRGNRR